MLSGPEVGSLGQNGVSMQRKEHNKYAGGTVGTLREQPDGHLRQFARAKVVSCTQAFQSYHRAAMAAAEGRGAPISPGGAQGAHGFDEGDGEGPRSLPEFKFIKIIGAGSYGSVW